MMPSELGLDRWLADQASELVALELSAARVTAVDRGRYLVRNEEGEVPAELTGKLLHLAESSVDLPCVGDWVCVRYRDAGSQASIHSVLPRRSFLRRKAAGRDVEFQMIAANIDVAFIVQSCHFDFNIPRLERYLVMARDGHIEPVVLLTKTDLVSPDELERLIGRIRRVGVDAKIVCVSNVTGAGVDQVRELMAPGKTYCLLGSSGVGKTTLINRLLGEGARHPRGQPDRRGASHHHAAPVDRARAGGLLIDMPGMRELGMLGAGEGIEETFADITALASELPVSRLPPRQRAGLCGSGGGRAARTERGAPAELPEAPPGIRLPRPVANSSGAGRTGPSAGSSTPTRSRRVARTRISAGSSSRSLKTHHTTARRAVMRASVMPVLTAMGRVPRSGVGSY